MNSLKSIWKNHHSKFLTLCDQALVSGTNFMVGIALTRWLGLEGYGTFSLVWLMVLFAGSIQQSALNSSLYALLPQQKAGNQFIAQLLGLQMIFSAAVTLTIASLTLFSSFLELSSTTLLWGALFSGLFILNDFLRRIAYAKHQNAKVLIMDGLGYGLQIPAFLVLHQAGDLSLNSALAVMSFSNLLSIATSFGLIQVTPSFKNFKCTVLEVWSYSRYLIGTAFLQWFSGNFYLVAAAGILGAPALGAIRIAQNLMGVLHVLLHAMENLIPIQAAETLHKQGAKATSFYLYNSFLKLLLPFAALLGGIAIFSEELLELLYGVEFSDYAFVLLGFCGIYVLIILGTQLRFAIRTFERNHLIFWSYVLTSILGVSTASIFIQQFDLLGVLFGIGLTQFILVGFYLYSLKTEISWLIK